MTEVPIPSGLSTTSYNKASLLINQNIKQRKLMSVVQDGVGTGERTAVSPGRHELVDLV